MGQAESRDRAGARPGGWGAGGRPLKCPGASRLPASPPPGTSAPPRSPAPPPPAPPICVLPWPPARHCSRKPISTPSGAAATLPFNLQRPGGGAGPRGGAAGPGQLRTGGRRASIHQGSRWSVKTGGRWHRGRNCKEGEPSILKATVKKIATNKNPCLYSSPGSVSFIPSSSFTSPSLHLFTPSSL